MLFWIMTCTYNFTARDGEERQKWMDCLDESIKRATNSQVSVISYWRMFIFCGLNVRMWDELCFFLGVQSSMFKLKRAYCCVSCKMWVTYWLEKAFFLETFYIQPIFSGALWYVAQNLTVKRPRQKIALFFQAKWFTYMEYSSRLMIIA